MRQERLTDIVRPLVEELGYEFVGLEWHGRPRNGLLRVYIDGRDGVGLEDCERVSHELSALLDVEDPIPGAYSLEISSPGLDRPLFSPEQYRRFVGQEISLTVFAPIDGRRRFKGRLVNADAYGFTLLQDGAEVAMEFDNVARARLVPVFDEDQR